MRLEALKIKLGDNSYEGNIEYSTHVQDYGWMNYSSNDSISGTIGQSKKDLQEKLVIIMMFSIGFNVKILVG